MVEDGHRCGCGGVSGDTRVGEKQIKQMQCANSSFQTGELIIV